MEQHMAGAEVEGPRSTNDAFSTVSTLKELLSQVELPQTTSMFSSGISSQWEQVQFWDQFLRSLTPRQLVNDMRTKVEAFGSLDILDLDAYDDIRDAVTWYQSNPMGDLEQLWDGRDKYALSTLLLSERMYLEGSWQPPNTSGHRRRSSATSYLWEESAMHLRRRRGGRHAPLPLEARVARRTELELHQSVKLFLRSNTTETRYQRDAEVALSTFSADCTQKACTGSDAAVRQVQSIHAHRSTTMACYFIAVLAFLIVAGSSTVALYFSIAKNRMQDGFSAASYILAAGTMLLGPWIATHYQHCNCRIKWAWRGRSISDELDIPLVPLARSSSIVVL